MAVERLPEPGDETWRRYAADHLARYQFAAERARDKVVLDAGTGIGYGAAILKEAGANRVDAVDIDEAVVGEARARFGRTGVQYLVSDSETLNGTSPPYDLVCSFENIEHLQKPDAFLRAAARVLAPNGVLLCSTPDRAIRDYVDGRPTNPYHVREWYRDEFRELLQGYFGRVEMMVQVKGHWYLSRQEAAASLQLAIDEYDSTIRGLARRAVNRLGRIVLKRPPRIPPWKYGAMQWLVTPSPADFPIVPESLLPLYGSPFCHLAVCGEPRG